MEKTILPFATYQTNEVFNSDVEKATVFCTTEFDREKGGRFFKKQDSEKIVFISKVLYPFWIVPLNEITLLIDGLNVAYHTITYPELPDLKAFIEKLNSQLMTRQVHASFLSNNQNYFQNSSAEQSLKIEGLINDTEFIEEFLEYAKQATITDSPINDSVLVTPAMSEVEVSKMLQNIENERTKLLGDLANLNEIIKLLNSKNRESQTALNKEIKSVEDEYKFKIQKVKTVLNISLAKINKEYTDKVIQVSDKFEQNMANLHKDLVKFQKEKEKLDIEIERAEAEIKTAAINKDDITEQKWKTKRKNLKEKQPEIASNLKEIQKQINETEEVHKNNLFQLKQDNELKIKQASKDLAEIEASRDAEIKVYQSQMEKIEELTSNIIKKVDELAINRESTLPEFDQLGIKQKKETKSLVYMPFYLSCYQSKSKKRYAYLAPSNVNKDCLSTKLKALGKTKISQLLQPKSKKITSILNSFIGLLDENIVFNREISEACIKTNLLHTRNAGTATKNGLEKLKEDGWLSNSECEDLNQAVIQYFSD
jgi:hypothetical protein